MKKIVVGCFLLLWLPMAAMASDSVRIAALLTGGEQRAAFLSLVRGFEREERVTVEFVPYTQDIYKNRFEDIISSPNAPDVMYWQGGERLRKYIRDGHVHSLEKLWQSGNFDDRFDGQMREVVSFDSKPYAMPYAAYRWGFYYRKSVFSNLGLTPPETWDEFLALCEALKAKGVTPLAVGAKDKWPAAAWFDYLNLRLNGYEQYRDLLSGNVSYQSDASRQVFTTWKGLIDKEYFLSQPDQTGWKEVLPYIMRKRVAMVLFGDFLERHIPDNLKDDFAYFPFPQMNPVIAKAEIAPTEIFLIPQNARKKHIAERFLTYLARADVQTSLNESLGYIPANKESLRRINQNRPADKGPIDLGDRVVQFYDREVNQDMANIAIGIFADFFSDPNIEHSLQRLEAARVETYVNELTKVYGQ